MSMLTSLVLFGLSNTAFAGSPYIQPISLDGFSEWPLADKTGNIGSVELEGTVDIPLYTDNQGVPTLQTFVKSDGTQDGERGDLFRLIPETSIIIVTEDFATRNALDIKVTNKRLIPVPEDFKVGGEIKYVTIPSLDLGGVVLYDVTAFVSGEHSGSKINGGLALPNLSIGLGALPASYAVLYSKGVLRVSEDGASLMSEMGATGVPYKTRSILEGTQGEKTLSGANKKLLPGKSLIVQATFGEQTVTTSLELNNSGSSLDKYVDVQSDIVKYHSDLRQDWMQSSIGETSLPHSYISRAVEQSFSDGVNPIASLGSDVLSQFDIVVDKTTETIGLSAHSGITGFQALHPITLEDARKALVEKSDENAENSEDSEQTEEASDETALNIAGINGLIVALEMGGAYEEALTQYELLIADEGEQSDCQLWLNYGKAQVALGNTNEGRKAFLESSRLYHSWWDLELHARMDINNDQADMNEEEIEYLKSISKDAEINSIDEGWYISQPESCFVADGMVARMDLVSGNYSDVENNYRTNLDLDDGLARLLGNSALIEGKTELAHEAYRQAVRLENGPDDRALNRLGLALVYADQGKWEQANDLFMEVQELQDDPLSAMIWLSNASAQGDVVSARSTLQSWADAHPKSAGVRLALLKNLVDQRDSLSAQLTTVTSETEEIEPAVDDAVELENSQQTELAGKIEALDAEISKSISEVQDWMNGLTSWTPNEAAMNILLLTYTGDLEGAESLMQNQSSILSGSATLNFAAANLFARQGKVEEAATALKHAATLSPEHAGLALTLQ